MKGNSLIGLLSKTESYTTTQERASKKERQTRESISCNIQDTWDEMLHVYKISKPKLKYTSETNIIFEHLLYLAFTISADINFLYIPES